MDEVKLALAAKEGDLNAFNRLVLIHQEMAYNLAYRILSSPDLAEDAAQNAFIAAYNNLSSYRGGSFKSWLLRIVTNQCYDELRRQKRQPIVALEPINSEDNEAIESPSWLMDDSPSPEDTVEVSDLENAIEHCLEDLPDDFRAIVVMVDVEGFNYKEVSKAIRRPLGTVKSRLARARLKMQDCLQGFKELLPDKFRLENEAST
jgi:RNA polymerase sigma-70 factor (ECF subfamily)